MRRYNISQTDLNEVLNNSCHVIFALVASALEITSLQLPSFSDTSSAKHGSHLLEENQKETY